VDKVCVYGHKKVIMLLSAWPTCNGAAGLQADHQASGRSQACTADGVTSYESRSGLSLVNLAFLAGLPVNVHQAKTQSSRLIDAAHAGETNVVAKDGKPWARLVPLEQGEPRRQPGVLKGQLLAAQAELEQLILLTLDPALAGCYYTIIGQQGQANSDNADSLADLHEILASPDLQGL
jgi:antitoxin (DNA-binding transcriptional repressor) of toxin-antitoxin stability system